MVENLAKLDFFYKKENNLKTFLYSQWSWLAVPFKTGQTVYILNGPVLGCPVQP
jgi:hypothetical protein